MGKITVGLMKTADFSGGVRVTFAPAPETVTLTSPGKEVGEVRFNPADHTALVSLGKAEKVNAEMLRRAGGLTAKWLSKNGVEAAGLALDGLDGYGMSLPEAVFALVEGMVMGAYTFDEHKSGEKDALTVSASLLTDGPTPDLEDALRRAIITAEGTNLARTLAHQPPNVINPVTLAAKAQALAAEYGLKCTVIDDAQLEAMGAGAIHAVGKGSDTPSRLIILEHPGEGGAPIALVGKAITFDTGGYSIKTTEGIVGMKYDKSGGMAVLATLVTAARLGLKQRVVGVIAAAENMISGGAYRPNDILRALNGKTIEIISTDAEGRLVLADALTYTEREFQPKAMIDIATLTGAVVIALGSVRAGVMGNNDALCQSLVAAGERTFERLWQLPMDEEYFQQIKGDDSDMKNSGGRKAGSIIGGTFLKQFVTDATPWAHVDIAGVMEAEKDLPYCPKGGMGFGVRLFLDYIQSN
ncbi:MAG: leucyl aminopeptidase [Anaerolineales bacterium]